MKTHISIVILILVVSSVIYSNSLDNSFQYDDAFNIVENTLIRDFKNIPAFFTKPVSSSSPRWKAGYRPLLMTSFTINYKLGKLNVRGYHIVNILFHIMNSVLVYVLIFTVLSLGEKKEELPENRSVKYIISLFVSLLFAVHPINTEAVNYIWQRSVLMASFFYLVTIILFIRYFKANKFIILFFSMISYALALLSKEIAISLPIIIMVIDLYFISGFNRDRFIQHFKKYHSLFLLITLLYLVMRFFGHGAIKEFSSPDKTGMFKYFITQPGVIIEYLKLIFFPGGLSIYHDYPVAKGITDVNVLFSLAVILLAILVSIKLIKVSRLASLFILWFFIVLLPTSSILPLHIIMNEHRLYLPCIGIFTAFTALLFKLIHDKPRRKFLIAFLSIIIIVFSMLTLKRNTEWKDEYTLWSETVRQYPENAHANNYLGMGIFDKGLIDRAIELFEKSVELVPGNSFFRNNLGSAYASKGLIDKAIMEFEEAIRLNPERYDVYNNLGNAYFLKKFYDRAIEYYKNAILLNPSNIDAYDNLIRTYSEKNMNAEAKEVYERALKIDPNSLKLRNLRVKFR